MCLQPLGKHGQYGPAAGGVFMVYSDTSIQPHVEQLFTGVGQVLVQHWPYTFAGLDPIVQPERQLHQRG